MVVFMQYWVTQSGLCTKNRPLDLTKLCSLSLEVRSQMTCSHCRFRQSFFALRALPRSKIISNDPRAVKISGLLNLNSEAIVKFCVKKLKFGVTGKKNVEVVRSDATEIKCSITKATRNSDYLVRINTPVLNMDPVAKLHKTFFTLAQNIDLESHLHNRFSHPNRVKIIQYGAESNLVPNITHIIHITTGAYSLF